MFALWQELSNLSTPHGSKRFWAGWDPLIQPSHLSLSCSQATESRQFCARAMQLLSQPEPSFNRHKIGKRYTLRHIILVLTIMYLIPSRNLSGFLNPVSLWHFLLDWYAHDLKCLHRWMFLYANNLSSLKVYATWSSRSAMCPEGCFKFFVVKKGSVGER